MEQQPDPREDSLSEMLDRIDAPGEAREMTEQEFAALQLNQMIEAQARTISAFSHRVHELEMRIIELMAERDV
jgi:hypothetical protein